MENFEEIDPISPQDDEVEALWISEDVRSYLYETAKWTKFLSIVGFVFAGITAVGAFGAGAVLSALGPNNPLSKIGAAGLTIVYLVFALIEFYPSYLLYKFSASTNQAVLFGDQLSLSDAMHKMKSFFKFWGIIMIAFIAFYAMMIITIVVAGIAVAGR